MNDEQALISRVRAHFEKNGVRPQDVKVRSFPGEHIVIVEVVSQLDRAVKLGNELDAQIADGFITVRQVSAPTDDGGGPVASVRDTRVTRLIGLLDERSRTSETQPSLRYVEDVDGRLQVAGAARHHLIFGRRGAGKTALMLEAKRNAEKNGNQTIWLNVQTLRNLRAYRAFLTLTSRLCDLPLARFQSATSPRESARLATDLKRKVNLELDKQDEDSRVADTLVAELNHVLRVYLTETQLPLFIFLDDVHYLPYADTPRFLDMVHGATRDNSAWLKIAGIKHQMRWFLSEPPTGLQLGHDAIEIDLDITLQEPERAKRFLQHVLDSFVDECDARPRRGFLSASAIDRLVLASGGVPRDFMTLCAASIQIARSRPKARTTGVQDVNEAAGQAAKRKLQELEEDAAAALGSSRSVLGAIQEVRSFCLLEREISFFRIDFLDKETHVDEYARIQRLMDLRWLHLINASLSDGHKVGSRSEVYLLDLSEYTAARLKQKLWVLDFARGHLTLKRTRSQERVRIGGTARELVAILRRGPVFDLSRLSGIAGDTAS